MGANMCDNRAGLAVALRPVLKRLLEVGTGQAALRMWVRAAGHSGGRADERLVRTLAERLAERLRPAGLDGTVAEQHRQTVGSERARLKGGDLGETVVG